MGWLADITLTQTNTAVLIVVAIVGLPLSLRELTRTARLRRALKDDVALLSTLSEGPSRATMQNLVDEQVARLWRASHPSRGAQAQILFGLALVVYGAGILVLTFTGVVSARQSSVANASVGLVLSFVAIGVTAYRLRKHGWRTLLARRRGASGGLDERRPEQNEHDSA